MAEVKQAADRIVMRPVGQLTPYEKNPRRNAEAVDAVAASIRAYGFKSPIQITESGVVINGHTRLKAAKKLGMKQVPCVVVSGLTEEEIRQYRLIDNKTSEYAKWDKQLLAEELDGLKLDLDFDFDFSEDIKMIDAWGTVEKFCDLKERPVTRTAAGLWFQAMYKTGKTGTSLNEIKTEKNVPYFADTIVRFVRDTLGENLRNAGWCVATTPRRRHKTGFHFATAVCFEISERLTIPFYEDIAICNNRNRLNPIIEQIKFPEEKNVLLYDDVLTTGVTMKTTREVLLDSGYAVLPLVSIVNK